MNNEAKGVEDGIGDADLDAYLDAKEPRIVPSAPYWCVACGKHRVADEVQTISRGIFCNNCQSCIATLPAPVATPAMKDGTGARRFCYCGIGPCIKSHLVDGFICAAEDARAKMPTPAMKDEVESATTAKLKAIKLIAAKMYPDNLTHQAIAEDMWSIPTPGSFSEAAFDVIAELIPQPSPTLEDEVKDDDSYVGWARYVRRTGYPARLHLCDSIDEGAFKIYRRPR